MPSSVISRTQRCKGSIATRLILIISLGTSLIFATMLGFTQWRAHRIIEHQVIDNARNITSAAAAQIATILEDTSWVVERMAGRLQAGMTDETLRQMLRATLEHNPQIYGSTVAFEPQVLANPSRRYAPYIYRKENKSVFRQLEDSYDYVEQDWYRIPHAQGRASWSEPYFDEGGGDSLMTTFSVPFQSGKDGRFAGIVTADINLDWLASVLGEVKVLKSGYLFLLSADGKVLFHPNRKYIMQETARSLAEKNHDERFRTLGERMMRGESDFVPYQSPMGFGARLYFGPIPKTGWSLGIVFPKAELFQDVTRLSLTVATLGTLGILLIALVVMVVSRTITRPLQDLALAAGRISGGDFNTRLPAAKARDEVGDLSRAMTLMQQDLQQHIQELVDTTSAKERIESELAIAHNIQLSLLPRIALPFAGKGAVDLFAIIEPAKEVGGDFYDFFWLDEQRLCLVIADVSGKGVPAALFMAVSKTLLKTIAASEPDPAAMLKRLNNQLASDNDESMFVTLFCALLELDTGLLTYANAGHNPPLLIPADGNPGFLHSRRQLVIGAMPDYDYQNEQLRLGAGDRLLLYTDGVTEAMNTQDEPYGEQRLLTSIEQLKELCVVDMLNCTLANVKAFSGTAPQSDDITLMALDFMQPMNTQGNDQSHAPD